MHTRTVASSGNSHDNPQVILRIKEVARRLGISVSTVWVRIKPGTARYDPAFPRPIILHANTSGKGAIGFRERDIEAYLRLCETRRSMDT